MSHDNPRIKSLNMSALDMIMALAEGNPGALRVLAELCRDAATIDPDSALGAFGPLFGLDNLDCYGSRIWLFFKDICGQDLRRLMGVLRAVQLGIVSGKTVNRAIDGDRACVDAAALLAAVQERLPDFGRIADEPAKTEA